MEGGGACEWGGIQTWRRPPFLEDPGGPGGSPSCQNKPCPSSLPHRAVSIWEGFGRMGAGGMGFVRGRCGLNSARKRRFWNFRNFRRAPFQSSFLGSST